MSKHVYSFDEFPFGTDLIQDLILQKESVRPFAGRFNASSLNEMMASRNSFEVNRSLLVSRLKSQNAVVTLSPETQTNIESLSHHDTFTITTGHQLNLFTGPLYSIYKIAQVIQLANYYSSTHPGKKFVPVFWMATEDHDFEEINHVQIFQRKISWEKNQQEGVVCGRLKTDSLAVFCQELEQLFREEEVKEKIREWSTYYLNSENLAEATRKLINVLFGKYGIVIIDGDDLELKQIFAPIMQREISEGVVFSEVTKTNKALDALRYHQQVHVRECNLFFIHTNGKRERIVFQDGKFAFNNGEISANELCQRIEKNPQSFSPNALMRPIYQELILPNLQYIGGGGEIAYWLQLRSVFEKMNVSFPLLRVRDSVFVMTPKQQDELEKLNLSLPELQQSVEEILKRRVQQVQGDTLSLNAEMNELDQMRLKLSEKVKSIDPGISGMVEAEFAKMKSALEKVEAKLIKAEKSKDESSRTKIQKLQDRLFPNGHFQEREENLLNHFFATHDFIQAVLETVQPEPEPKIRILKLV